jgi:hypothetical protein
MLCHAVRVEQLAESLHGIAFPSPAVPSTPTASADPPSEFDNPLLHAELEAHAEESSLQVEVRYQRVVVICL